MTSTIAVFTLTTLCITHAKVIVNGFYDCDSAADYPIKISAKLNMQNDMQVVEEGTVSSKVPLGEDILEIVEVSVLENDKYDHLVTIKENLCEAMRKYLGEFMHDLQKSAGIEAGTCPVPPGDYKISNHVLDFEKFKYKNIPLGQLKAKVDLLDIKTNETLNCHYVEFTLTGNN